MTVGSPLSNAIIQVQDILEWKKFIYVRSDQVIANPADVIRISDLLAKNRPYIGNSVRNGEGTAYGHVYNLDFDSITYYLKNISVQKSILGFFGYDKRIFPYERIVEVLETGIIVDDKNKEKEEVLEPKLDTSVNPAA